MAKKKATRKPRANVNESAPTPTGAIEPRPAPRTPQAPGVIPADRAADVANWWTRMLGPLPLEHPARELLPALHGLSLLSHSTYLLRELAERRSEARGARLNLLNTSGTLAEQWQVVTEMLEGRDSLPLPLEPQQLREHLRSTLENGKARCEQALPALREGGAAWLDAVLPPSAAGPARSIELHTKLRSAERVIEALMAGLGLPNAYIDDHAAEMVDLAVWFARAWDEMIAVAETRGLVATVRTPTEAGAGDGQSEPTALPAGIALTADHESMLAVLRRNPQRCMTVIEVTSVVKIRNRETVGRLLGELAGFGFVHRPHGRRKGYTLTDAQRVRPGATPT